MRPSLPKRGPDNAGMKSPPFRLFSFALRAASDDILKISGAFHDICPVEPHKNETRNEKEQRKDMIHIEEDELKLIHLDDEDEGEDSAD